MSADYLDKLIEDKLPHVVGDNQEPGVHLEQGLGVPPFCTGLKNILLDFEEKVTQHHPRGPTLTSIFFSSKSFTKFSLWTGSMLTSLPLQLL